MQRAIKKKFLSFKASFNFYKNINPHKTTFKIMANSSQDFLWSKNTIIISETDKDKSMILSFIFAKRIR